MTWKPPPLSPADEVEIAVGNQLRIANARFDQAARDLWLMDADALELLHLMRRVSMEMIEVFGSVATAVIAARNALVRMILADLDEIEEQP